MDADGISVYQQEIEALKKKIRALKREQEKLSDPSNEDERDEDDTPDFESNAYVSKEVELGVKIRDMETKLGVLKKRLEFIYGDE